jgi:hypothetical protein
VIYIGGKISTSLNFDLIMENEKFSAEHLEFLQDITPEFGDLFISNSDGQEENNSSFVYPDCTWELAQVTPVEEKSDILCFNDDEDDDFEDDDDFDDDDDFSDEDYDEEDLDWESFQEGGEDDDFDIDDFEDDDDFEEDGEAYDDED